MADLYQYLPTFVRMRDRLASGLLHTDSGEAVLEKIVSCLASVFDETDEFIQDLMTLGDPDRCDPDYFMHLSYVLGTLFPTGGNEEQVRHLIKNLVSFYKTKGTHHSWGKAWAWLNQGRPGVVELYKTIPQEVLNYSATESAVYPLKSARIDLTTCQSYCQAYCEEACEAYCEEDVEIGTRLSRAEALDKLKYVDEYRPIQVLLRLDAEDIQLRSELAQMSDTIGHYPPDYEPPVWMGSQVEGDFSDELLVIVDSVDIDVQCVSSCETACQGCCEIQCECDACEVTCQAGSCQEDCTSDCQAHCEFQCESSCQFSCTGCQAGVCTAACAGACTACQAGTCTGTCAGACTACQAGACTGDCAGACQGTCQANCTACMAGVCTAACAGAVTST